MLLFTKNNLSAIWKFQQYNDLKHTFTLVNDPHKVRTSMTISGIKNMTINITNKEHLLASCTKK